VGLDLGLAQATVSRHPKTWIRIGAPEETSLLLPPLGQLRDSLVAAPALIRDAALIQQEADLDGVPRVVLGRMRTAKSS